MAKFDISPKGIIFSLIAAAISGVVESGVEKGLHAWDDKRNRKTLAELEAATNQNVEIKLEELDK